MGKDGDAHGQEGRQEEVLTTDCPACGQTLRVGDYPFCPHGRGSNSIEDVTWPGGITFENLGHEPCTLYSPAELKRELNARGLQECVRCAPGDQHTKSWATMDAYTLENARVLAERQAHTKATNGEEPPNRETVALVRDVYAELSAR